MVKFSLGRRGLEFGLTGGQGAFGAPQQRWCQTCGQTRTFRDQVTWRGVHILLIFRFVTHRAYASVCEVCHTGQVIEPPADKRAGIPFFDQFGWAVGLAGAAALIVAGVPSMMRTEQDQAARLAQPKVGDLYEVDLTRATADPNDPASGSAANYAIMQVSDVTPTGVEVRLGAVSSPSERKIRDDLIQGPARRPDYFAAQTFAYTLADLRRGRL